MDLPKILHTVFLRSPPNLFDEFIKECQVWYSQPAHSLVEIRKRNNKKISGDIFEEFCILYLTQICGYEEAWRLEDLPEKELVELSMVRKDMGIDLIVRHKAEYYAVQCKYKTPTDRKSCVTWAALSTFYALCLRTGPWAKYIVMTNCDYTRRQGPKTPQDVSICLQTFRALTKEDWTHLCKLEGVVLDTATSPLTQEELRQKRLAYFQIPK
jgi:hypothetical protein